jgi:hypothetical protein|tara:strand:+ start:389 stop:574 length:186 start_codon:yes stop_codon:yes gene_type:complete
MTKQTTLGLIILFFLLISLGGCKSQGQMTGKESVQEDQNYYNYDAAMQRAKQSEKKSKNKN